MGRQNQQQKQNNGKKAEEHLNKAADILGQNQKDQKKQDGKKDQNDQQKQDGKKDQKDQKKQDGKKEQMPQPQNADANQNENQIDKNQAESILEQMGDEEKELRNAIKMYKMKNTRIPPVTKDW